MRQVMAEVAVRPKAVNCDFGRISLALSSPLIPARGLVQEVRFSLVAG